MDPGKSPYRPKLSNFLNYFWIWSTFIQIKSKFLKISKINLTKKCQKSWFFVNFGATEITEIFIEIKNANRGEGGGGRAQARLQFSCTCQSSSRTLPSHPVIALLFHPASSLGPEAITTEGECRCYQEPLIHVTSIIHPPSSLPPLCHIQPPPINFMHASPFLFLPRALAVAISPPRVHSSPRTRASKQERASAHGRSVHELPAVVLLPWSVQWGHLCFVIFFLVSFRFFNTYVYKFCMGVLYIKFSIHKNCIRIKNYIYKYINSTTYAYKIYAYVYKYWWDWVGAKQTVRVHSDNPLSIRSLLQNSSYALAHRCRFI